jgi:hypothetical protein
MPAVVIPAQGYAFGTMRAHRKITLLALPVLIAAIDGALSLPANAAAQSVEDEVVGNILRQGIGEHTVADLHLPDEFVRRLADRIILSSFEDRFRKVVADAAAATPASRPGEPPENVDVTKAPDWLRVVCPQIPGAALDYQRSLPSTRPPLRGFAPRLKCNGQPWPFDASKSPGLRDAADLIAQRLASDGLLRTLVGAIDCLGSEAFLADESGSLSLLVQAGFPVDLLNHFRAPPGSPGSVVHLIAAEIDSGATAVAMRATLDSITFEFQPSDPGFTVAIESGQHEIDSLRVQLTRGGYWDGPGDGGNSDLLRQLVQVLPEASIVAAVERKHLPDVFATARPWLVDRPNRVTLLVSDLPLAQWAQDNGKSGMIVDRNGVKAAATILPRYASRGDDGSTFVAGETFVPEALVELDHAVLRSPLLFQGGNLLPIQVPATDERILLMGEAELHRNTAMGLSQDQVLEAFRREFGVDRCEVLPAVSFHIDYDVTVRAHRGRLIAFVTDADAGAKVVLRCGLKALEGAGAIDQSTARAAAADLDAERLDVFLRRIGPRVAGFRDAHGHYPLSLAEDFSTAPTDSGVGNLHRFLLAMDTTAAGVVDPADLDLDPYTDYLRVLARQEQQRQALQRRLADLGFEVVPVPGLPGVPRGIVYLNGIHDRTRYLMPAYGGLYEPLDSAAASVFDHALNQEVEVVPILSGESQRRAGGLHCSCAVHPRL